ncbi:MAG: histidine kinase N-terminal 7TM domain-containing protein [Anaerolineae bacterium]
MYWFYVIYTAILFVTAVGMGVLAVYVWRQPDTARTRWITTFLTLSSLLAFNFLLIQFSTDGATMFFWARLRFLFIAPVAPLSFLIVINHLDMDRWVRPRHLAIFALVPMITNVLIWTAPQYFWSNWSFVRVEFLSLEMPSYTGWYQIHVFYSYGMFVATAVVLLQQITRAPAPYRGQSLLLFIGMVIVVAFNAPSTLSVLPRMVPNLTPIGGAILAIIFTWVISRYKFLNLAPVAYERVIYSISDVVFVLDPVWHVLDINPSAEKLVQTQVKDAVGRSLVDLVPATISGVKNLLKPYGAHRSDITITEQGTTRYFDINGSALHRNGEHVGYVLILRDVTEQKRIAQTVQRQNQYLKAQYEIVLDLLGRTEMENLLQSIVNHAAQIMDTPYCEIMLKEGEELVMYAYTANQAYRKGDRIQRGQALLTWQAFDTQQPVVIDDYAEWTSRNPAYEGIEVHAVASFPIVAEDVCLGVMDLSRSEADMPFSPDQVQQGVVFSQLAALTIRNAQHQQQARALAASEERSRLARDLHDNVMQTLFSASLIAQSLPYYGRKNEEQMWQDLDKLNRLTRGALAEMRTLLFELRPTSLTAMDLKDMLNYLVTALVGQTDATVKHSFEGSGALPPEVQIATYRIAQESFNNINKHAHATEISATLNHGEDFVEMTISDNGQGFDLGPIPADHFGLQFMRERATAINAELLIISKPGGGTKVNFSWKDNKE